MEMLTLRSPAGQRRMMKVVLGAASCAAVIIGFVVAREDLRERDLGETPAEETSSATPGRGRRDAAGAPAFPPRPSAQTPP